jgi:hypothetical protein
MCRMPGITASLQMFCRPLAFVAAPLWEVTVAIPVFMVHEPSRRFPELVERAYISQQNDMTLKDVGLSCLASHESRSLKSPTQNAVVLF